VLGEWPAGAREVAAPAQPRVQRVQHRPAELPQFHLTQRGQDRAPDIALVGFPSGWVELGDRHVLLQQVGKGGAGLRPPPDGRLLQQLAQQDQGLLLGLRRLPMPQLSAGQRIGARVYVNPVGAAR